MAIHVTTNYYWIDPPKELTEKMSDLAFISACAKRLKLNDIHNKTEQLISDLYNQWDKEGSALAKKKSSTNWLGAGSKYMAGPMMPREFYTKVSEAFVEELPIEQCEKELKNMLSKIK